MAITKKPSQSILGNQNREYLSILITDSGLGGLSICADMVNRLAKRQRLRELSVIYFNAWPFQNRGYNLLTNDEERLYVFSNALKAMDRYRPDMIYIACNTLSVLFQQGSLATMVKASVTEIINFGVSMIAEALRQQQSAIVLILGTKMTISSGIYKKRLVSRSFPEERIIQQDCHGLASEIEQNPKSTKVYELVEQYMIEASVKIPPGTKKIIAALCCTHYDYIKELIQCRLSFFTGVDVHIINPNNEMSKTALMEEQNAPFPTMKTCIKVLSRVELSSTKITAISSRLENISKQTAIALQNYQCIPDLFEI